MRFDKKNILGGPDSNINDHDELVNRDLLNQHPIYSITGLQEVLNNIEDEIYELSKLWTELDSDTNTRVDSVILDIRSIEQSILEIISSISEVANTNAVDNVEDTASIDLNYNKETKTLKGDVKVFKDVNDSNALQIFPSGLFVPKTIGEETTTVKWTQAGVGESLSEIYNSGTRFSHYAGSWSNLYNSTSANAWRWNSSSQSLSQPNNYNYCTGFVSANFYDSYIHAATFSSSYSNNGVNGIVIGFVFDENNYPHTLSALCSRGGCGINNWALVYDFTLPDQQILFTAGNGDGGGVPSGGGTTNWSSVSSGITIQVTKNNNIITAACSDWNKPGVINEATTITINLDDYEWGYLFKGAVRYGYCNRMQASSFVQNASFYSDNITCANKFAASVKVSSKENNEITIENNGIYAPKFIIDPDSTNALKKRTNGYYTEAFRISPDSYNMLSKRDNGYYVEQFHTSAATNNAIIKKNDGYFVQEFLISSKVDNALVHETDGYFVQGFKISAEAENCLLQKEDGYYVREQSNVRSVLQAAHGFVVGDFIYYHPQNKYKKALAKDDYDSNIVGMVTKVMDINTFEYQPGGFFKTNLFNSNRGYIQGMPLYISDVDEGKVTQIQPDLSKAVGYPVEDIGIVISIERGIQYNQEYVVGDFRTSANTYNVRSDGFIRIVEGVEYRTTLIQKLLDTLSEEFKEEYIVVDTDNDVIRFIKINELYVAQKVPYGLYLFVKAF